MVVDKEINEGIRQVENEHYSIDNIFKEIEETYLRNKKRIILMDCIPKSIEVEYDNEYFYPRKYSTYNKCPPGLMDGGGCTYWISDFNVMN